MEVFYFYLDCVQSALMLFFYYLASEGRTAHYEALANCRLTIKTNFDFPYLKHASHRKSNLLEPYPGHLLASSHPNLAINLRHAPNTLSIEYKDMGDCASNFPRLNHHKR